MIRPKSMKDLLSSPDRWTQGAGARNATGNRVEPKDPNAICFCLLSAIFYVYGRGSKGNNVWRDVMNRIDPQNIIDWNDDPERTFDDVRALVEELGI